MEQHRPKPRGHRTTGWTRRGPAATVGRLSRAAALAVAVLATWGCTLEPLPVVERIALYQAIEITPLDGSRPEATNPPIVAERDALLRVFLGWGRNAWPAPVEATVELDGEVIGTTTAELTRPSEAGDLESTLNVQLPAAALTGSGAFQVTVGGSGTSYRWPADGPGWLTVADTGGPFQVVLVPVVNGGLGPTIDDDIVESYRRALLRLLPVSAVDLQVRDPYTFERDLCEGWAAIEMLALEILAIRAQDEAPPNTYYVGLMAPSATAADYVTCAGGILGMSLVGWNRDDTYARGCVAAGYFADGSSLDSEGTVVHELGHALGRRHAPCGAASGPDSYYPHADGAIGVWGWDSSRNVLHDPLRSKDFMSYCSPAWVSDYHYVKLFDRIAYVNAAAEETTATAATPYHRLVLAEDGAARWLGPTPVRRPGGDAVPLRLATAGGESSPGHGHRYQWSHGRGSLVLVAADQLRGRHRLELGSRAISIPEALR